MLLKPGETRRVFRCRMPTWETVDLADYQEKHIVLFSIPRTERQVAPWRRPIFRPRR